MYIDVFVDMYNVYVEFKTPYPSGNRRIRVHSLRIRLNEKHGRAFIVTDVHVQDTYPYTWTTFACHRNRRIRTHTNAVV
jgi:hypothetical protein